MTSAVPLTPATPEPAPEFARTAMSLRSATTDGGLVPQRGLAQIRSEMREQPTISAPGDFALTLQLLDRIERLQQLSEGMVRKIEQESGLRRSEFMLLRALEGGESHPRRVGRAVGLQTEAVLATAEALASSGLLSMEHTPDGAVALILTDAGRSVLTQAEAVQIRATDAAIQHVGPEGAQRAITVLDSMIEAMDPIADDGAAMSVDDLPTGA